MRLVIGTLLLVAALAALGYLVWLFVADALKRPGERPGKSAIGVVVALLFLLGIVAIPSSDDEAPTDGSRAAEQRSTSTASTAAETGPTSSTGPTGPTQTIQDAQELVEDDDYDGALVIATALGVGAEETIRRRIANRIGRRASAAVRRGSRGTARSLLASSSDYPSTKAVVNARAQLRGSEQRAAARRRELVAQRRRVKAAAAEKRRVERATARRRQEKEAVAAEENAPPSGGSFAGKTCGEIGMPFSVPPGSDPEHDADGDGEACESE